jgi:hypothetical protein
MGEPKVVVKYYKNYGMLVLRIKERWGPRSLPMLEMNKGSLSWTIGNFRMLRRYTKWLAIFRAVSKKGKPSTRQSRACNPTTKYIVRVSSRLATTVCSSTSSER